MSERYPDLEHLPHDARKKAVWARDCLNGLEEDVVVEMGAELDAKDAEIARLKERVADLEVGRLHAIGHLCAIRKHHFKMLSKDDVPFLTHHVHEAEAALLAQSNKEG
jgi:hypothetical protein